MSSPTQPKPHDGGPYSSSQSSQSAKMPIVHPRHNNRPLERLEARNDLFQSQSNYRVRGGSMFQDVSERPECNEISNFRVAFTEVSSERGVKRHGTMAQSEDRFVCKGESLNIICREEDSYVERPLSIFGVFDGHGGDAAAEFVSTNVGKSITHSAHFLDEDHTMIQKLVLAMEDDFIEVATEFVGRSESIQDTSGTTVCLVACLSGLLVFANLGDSEGILVATRFCPGNPMPMENRVLLKTTPHTMENSAEESRIHRVGGWFGGNNGKRLLGQLVPTRSIGDKDVGEKLEGVLASTPDFNTVSLRCMMQALDNQAKEDKQKLPAPWVEEGQPFVVIASDGLWDVFTKEEVSDRVSHNLGVRRAAQWYAGAMGHLMREEVRVEDRSYHLKVYKKCFVASEAIDWMVASNIVSTAEEGLALGNLLVECGALTHVAGLKDFQGGNRFYRFTVSAATESTQTGLSANLKGEDSTQNHMDESRTLSEEAALEAVSKAVHHKIKIPSITDALIAEAISRGSSDDISVVIAAFHQHRPSEIEPSSKP